jgi:hypothetical protein
VERVFDAWSEDRGTTPDTDALAAIRRNVYELSNQPRAEGVDEVWKALLAARSDPRLAGLIHELLDEGHIDRLRDSHGNTLRFVLVDTLLELGFPHALEVSPKDLELYRNEGGTTSRPGVLAAGFTVAAGVGSFAWAGIWMLLTTAMVIMKHGLLWALFPLAVAAAHGIAAVVYGSRAVDAGRDRPGASLAALGWMGFIGPAMIGIAQTVVGHEAWLLATFMAVPAMLTAALCGLTSWRLRRGLIA